MYQFNPATPLRQRIQPKCNITYVGRFSLTYCRKFVRDFQEPGAFSVYQPSQSQPRKADLYVYRPIGA